MSTPYRTAAKPSAVRAGADVVHGTTPAHGRQHRAPLGLRGPRREACTTASRRPPMPLSPAFISMAKWRITTSELSRPGSTVNATKGGISHDQ